MNWLHFFIILQFAHWVADFALQSNIMAERKNWRNEEKLAEAWIKSNPNVPYLSTWKYYLIAHGFIHGAMIYLFTGFTVFGLMEVFFHIIIDYLKTSGHINIHQDQLFHLICKIFYVVLFVLWGGF